MDELQNDFEELLAIGRQFIAEAQMEDLRYGSLSPKSRQQVADIRERLLALQRIFDEELGNENHKARRDFGGESDGDPAGFVN